MTQNTVSMKINNTHFFSFDPLFVLNYYNEEGIHILFFKRGLRLCCKFQPDLVIKGGEVLMNATDKIISALI